MSKTRSAKLRKPMAAPPEAVTITRGDHLIGLYATDDERLQLAVPFILDGLREGSVCFLIGPIRSTSAILAEIAKSRPQIAAEIAQGRLITTEHQDTPCAQYKFFEDRISAAQVRSFRLFADMIGARDRMSIDQILELERGFDDVITHKHPMAAVCAYDVRMFSGVDMLAVLRTHHGALRYAPDDVREKAAK